LLTGITVNARDERRGVRSGVQLVRELLDRQPNATLALLVRDPPGQSGQQRADLIVPPADRSRVQVHSGDVSQPNCGLDAAIYQRLSATTTRVIHSAATVRFDHSLDEARRMNVEGTRRMLDFAAGARQLRSLAYVGTAYVAGERTGLVRENELAVGQAYRNTYEQTRPRRKRWFARGSIPCPASFSAPASSSATPAPALLPASR